jgi:hypothetical protein
MQSPKANAVSLCHRADLIIRQITEMGEVGIDSVLDKTNDEAMRRSLQKQKEEYQRIYRSADKMLEERGGKEKDLNPMAEIGSEISAMFQLGIDRYEEKHGKVELRKKESEKKDLF